MPKRLKKKRVKQEAPSLRLAAEVASSAEIQDVRLVECHCQQTSLVSEENQEAEFGVTLGPDQVQVNKKDRFVGVAPKFHMVAKPEGHEGDDFSVRITAQFVLAYTISHMGGLTDEMLTSFGQINGVYNAWPYWREFVQSAMSRMGLPRILVPVYRIQTPQRKKAPKKAPVKKKRSSQ